VPIAAECNSRRRFGRYIHNLDKVVVGTGVDKDAHHAEEDRDVRHEEEDRDVRHEEVGKDVHRAGADLGVADAGDSDDEVEDLDDAAAVDEADQDVLGRVPGQSH